jgi:fibronectin type 3 domain-containing protein
MAVSKFKLIVAVLPILLSLGCESGPSNVLNVDPSDLLDPPRSIQATIGDRTVTLTWLHDSANLIDRFKIFRVDSADSVLREIATTTEFQFTDEDVQNNHTYEYRVATLGKNGLLGRKSSPVLAVPALYGVTINSGAQISNSLNVSLSFAAPQTTTFVRISNDSSFFDSQWDTYALTKPWTLTHGDGQKSVYVRFRDAGGRETTQIYKVGILLDTQAIIYEVFESSQDQVVTAGDSIHFRVVAQEPDGEAWIELYQVVERIELFDDGTRGDPVARDGVYETTYRISTGLQGESVIVIANFIDRGGNAAPSQEADTRVTIRQPPHPVRIITIAPVPGGPANARNIFWTRNSDADFARYELYRSTARGVTTSSSLITLIQSPEILSFADTSAVANTTYYYRVYVFDTSGLSSGSNEYEYTSTSVNLR